MLKTARKILLASALVSACGAASATQITDPVELSAVETISVGNPYVFTHTFSAGADPFIGGFDTIASATLSIHLIDTLTKGNEEFTIIVGSGSASQTYTDSNIDNGGGNDKSTNAWYVIPLGDALLDLISDGKLRFEVTAQSGSFEILGSKLTAEISPAAAAQSSSPTSVPEPGSLLLLGAGLVGIGLARRKKRQQTKTR